MRSIVRFKGVVVWAVSALSLAFAGPTANAATITFGAHGGDEVELRAARGAVDHVSVSHPNTLGNFTVSDSAGLTGPAHTCKAVPPKARTTLSCEPFFFNDHCAWDLFLGDRNDTASFRISDGPVTFTPRYSGPMCPNVSDGPGNDVVRLLAGPPRLTVVNGPGNDVFENVNRTVPALRAVRVLGPGNDRIVGTTVGDRLWGGVGRDTILARAGADRVYAVDAERDVIDCGPGADSARVDRIDTVRGCETITR